MMAPGHLDAVHEIVRGGGYPKVTPSSRAPRPATARPRARWTPSPTTTPRSCSTTRCARWSASGSSPTASRPSTSYGAVDVAIPSADTIIEVDADNLIRDVPPRAALRRGQTPQAFRASVIREAYARAAGDADFVATDDCTVVLRYSPEVPIWVVAGDDRNMKVTEPIDVYIAEKLFQLSGSDASRSAPTSEYRAALDGKTLVVFGGSYGIGGDIADLRSQLWRDGAVLQPVRHRHPRRAPRRRRPRPRARRWPSTAASTTW